MKELKIEEFYTIVISLLESILKEVVRENPNAESIFPCLVVPAPMKYDDKNGENIPLLSRFSITIEAWTKKKSSSIALIDEVDSLLRGYNFIKTSTHIHIYDEITK